MLYTVLNKLPSFPIQRRKVCDAIRVSSIKMMVLHHPIDLDLDLDLDLGLDLDLNLDLDFRLDDYWPNDIQLYDSTSSQ